MALKDEWKETGKDLGHAFAGLGRSILRSAKTGIDIAAGEEEQKTADGEPKSTVFNDGSWRKVGKDMGTAFTGLGKSVIHSVQTGVDAVDQAVPDKQPAGQDSQDIQGE